MIKVNYDATTGEIKGFYPDDIAYASIPAPYIELDESAHQDCINNQGSRKVDVTALKIVEYTPEVATLTKEEQISALDAEYQPQFVELVRALGVATLGDNTETIAAVKLDYASLTAEYQAKLKEIG